MCSTGLLFAIIAEFAKATDTNQPPNSHHDFEDLTLEQLVNVKITSVSKKETDLFASPAAISVVTADDMRRLGITSLPEALRLVPGMDVAQINGNQWAVSARGFNAQFGRDLLVLIDGRTVYTPGSSGVYWNSQDVVMEDLDRIEVIRGPVATLWGANAVNGVINIISKSARETQGLLLSSSVGSVEQDLVTMRYGGELATNLYYRVYVQRSDQDRLITTAGLDAGDSCNSSLAGFRLDWEPPSQNVLTLQGDYYYDVSGSPTEQITLSPPVDRPLVEEQHRARQVVLHEVDRLADHLGADHHLLVAGLVHEDQVGALLVEVLHVALVDVGRLELLTRSDVSLHDGAGQQVLELGAGERGALARLDELELDNRVRGSVHQDLEALANIGRLHARCGAQLRACQTLAPSSRAARPGLL